MADNLEYVPNNNTYGGVVVGGSGVNPISLILHYQGIAEQKRQEEIQRKKEREAHKAIIQKRFGELYDPEKYHTATDVDKIINERTSVDLLDLNKFIEDNPDASDNDIIALAQQKVEPIARLSLIGKSVKRYIDDTIEPYKKSEGVNVGALKVHAIHDALYKKDANDKWVLKTPEEMEDDLHNNNYITDRFKKYPESILLGDGGFSKHINSIKPTVLGGVNQTDNKGLKKRTEWNAELYPYQELDKDASGNVKGVKLRTEEVKIGDSRLKVIPEDVYKDLQTEPGSIAYIGKLMKEWSEKNKIQLDTNTPEYDIQARNLLVDELENKSAKKFITKNIQDEDTWRAKQSAGITVNVRNSGGVRDGGSDIRDIYGEVDKLTSSRKEGQGAPLNMLSATAQKILLKYTNEIAGHTAGGDGKATYTNSDIFIRKGSNGEINIVRKKDGVIIAPIDFEDINVPAQVGVKEKRSVLKRAQDFIMGKPKNTKKEIPNSLNASDWKKRK